MPDNNPTTPPDDEDEQRPETDYTFVAIGEVERRRDEDPFGPYDGAPFDAGPWS